MINYIQSGKVVVIHLIAGQIKKLLHKMSYYSEPDSYGRNNIKIALDLSD